VALVTTVLAVLLLFGFRTADELGISPTRPPAAVIGTPGRTSPGPAAVAGTPFPSSTFAAGAGATGTRPVATPAPVTASGTFTGDVIATRYGNVQVAVVENAGTIVDVQALQLPFDRRLSKQISDQAGPLLRSQVLRAQSADISGVSGASYTSEGYYESLRSALAKVP